MKIRPCRWHEESSGEDAAQNGMDVVRRLGFQSGTVDIAPETNERQRRAAHFRARRGAFADPLA